MPRFRTSDNQCPSVSASPFQDRRAGPETQAGCSFVPKAKKVVLQEFTASKVPAEDTPQPQNPIGRVG